MFHDSPDWLNMNQNVVPMVQIPAIHISQIIGVPRCHIYYYKHVQYQQLLQLIMIAVQAEAETINYYQELASKAPNEIHRKFIVLAIETTQQHVYDLTQLYTILTGHRPEYMMKKKDIPTYSQGLWEAYLNHLEGHKLYSTAYLNTHDDFMRDILFRAIHDEMEYANRFSFLYLSILLSSEGAQITHMGKEFFK